MNWSVHCADVLDWAAAYDGPKFHASLGDWPYELSFMGKRWDDTGVSFQVETWQAIAEHLHPGGFILAFGGSRTYHRLAVAAEDAGLVIHPALVWLQSQGFPKSTRIDTQIDKAAGAEREVVGQRIRLGDKKPYPHNQKNDNGWGKVGGREWRDPETAPATPLAATWAGHRYGLQALKPCAEFILCAQKPYAGKPVDCITSTGAGALWIDGSRVATGEDLQRVQNPTALGQGSGWNNHNNKVGKTFGSTNGRWPPNVCLSHTPGCRALGVKRVRVNDKEHNRHNEHPGNGIYGKKTKHVTSGYADPDGLESVDDWVCVDGCPVKAIGEQSGELKSGGRGQDKHSKTGWFGAGAHNGSNSHPSTGTAARFYPQFAWQAEVAERLALAEPFRYQAKAGKSERQAGLDGFYWRKDKNAPIGFVRISYEEWKSLPEKQRAQGNIHPTQKPIELCKFLATLLLPPPEYAPRRILIPFFGKGSEGCGAGLAGWEEIVGIEKEPDYCEAAEARLAHWLKELQLELDL